MCRGSSTPPWRHPPLLKETSLSPQYLELELTERADGGHGVDDVVNEVLKPDGLVLKVDDFGTGPSSLSYLQHCPVDVLKIDQSFVADIHPEPGGSTIIRAVIAMGKSLGCRIVAEGIETKRQFASRAELRRGQGFHFSPPVNADAFGRLLADAPFAIPVAD